MFGGKKEKALQDELYTIKKQIWNTSRSFAPNVIPDG